MYIYHKCIYIYMHICKSVYVYVHIYIFIYAYTHSVHRPQSRCRHGVSVPPAEAGLLEAAIAECEREGAGGEAGNPGRSAPFWGPQKRRSEQKDPDMLQLKEKYIYVYISLSLFLHM